MNAAPLVPRAVTPLSAWKEEPVALAYKSVPEWRDVVLEAYAMQPTLSLTAPQGQRLWGMDASTCGYVLDGLVESGMLARTSSGQYCRVDYIRPIDPVFAM